MMERLYSDLSWLWRLWGDPATEYADHVSFIIELIQKSSKRELRTALDLGCGGGKFIFTLKKHFEVTGLDLSPQMLALAKELNPEVKLLHGDMRSFSIGESFDLIFVDDALSYITSQGELASVLKNCHSHLAPDGYMVLTPDYLKEEFVQHNCQIFHSIPHQLHPGVEVTYITNDYDPDTSDDHFESAFVYLIRENGKLRIETDLHQLGLFDLDTWKKVLSSAGFSYDAHSYEYDGQSYLTFFCQKSLYPT